MVYRFCIIKWYKINLSFQVCRFNYRYPIFSWGIKKAFLQILIVSLTSVHFLIPLLFSLVWKLPLFSALPYMVLTKNHPASSYFLLASYSPAAQNMDKYIHIEILKVLANISYCFTVYAFVLDKSRYYSQVLVYSTVVNSRLKPSVHAYKCLVMLLCRIQHLLN